MATASQQMRNDWNAYWTGSTPGTTQNWINGTLTRNADGSATYRSNTGATTNFNQGMSFDDVAKGNSEIAAAWGNNYGYSVPKDVAVPTFQTPSISTSSANVAEGKVDDSMLVEKRLPGLLASGSPLMEQATAKAMNLANARGLLNSSIAAGAGTEAAISQALPIAQADSSTFFKQSLANQDAKNTASLAAANAANNAAIAQAGFNAQAQLAGINNAAAEGRMERQYQLESEQLDKKLAADTKTTTDAYQADYINKSLSTQSWMMDKIAAIQNSNIEDKQGAIAGVQDLAATMQTSINAVYAKVPGWSQEWLVLAQQGG